MTLRSSTGRKEPWHCRVCSLQQMLQQKSRRQSGKRRRARATSGWPKATSLHVGLMQCVSQAGRSESSTAHSTVHHFLLLPHEVGSPLSLSLSVQKASPRTGIGGTGLGSCNALVVKLHVAYRTTCMVLRRDAIDTTRALHPRSGRGTAVQAAAPSWHGP